MIISVLEGIDLPAVGGGVSILGAMVFIIRLAFSRLDKQDTTWIALLGAAERRAIAAETTLTELRHVISSDRLAANQQHKENKAEIERLSIELKEAKLQIKELQKWNGER